MRPLAAALLLVSAAVTACSAGADAAREIDNVAAFARLYGVARYFYPSDAAVELEWNWFAVHGVAQVRPARDSSSLRDTLARLFAPLGPGIEVSRDLPAPPTSTGSGEPLVAWRYLGAGFSSGSGPYRGKRTHRGPPAPGEADAELFEDAPPTPGAHAEFDLGLGLMVRVPLTLADSEARDHPKRRGSLEALTAAVEPKVGEAVASGLNIRLADVVVAWNVFRHFYPYWTETGVDWDACLRPQLERAAAATTRAAHRDALRSLVAEARDGHGGVTDTLAKKGQARLPVGLTVIDGRIVVTTSAVPEAAPVGAVVSAIGGTPASDWLARESNLSSGTTQWQQVRVFWPLLRGPLDGTLPLGLDDGTGPREVALTYDAPPPPETRPDPIAELEPGIWYVDLTRTKMEEITPKLDPLAAARAVVFDVRGYPEDSGHGLLPHLLDAPEDDRWMHVAKIVGPFGQWAGWQSYGWDMKPKSPHISGRIVFLTDGRAISYAESVMGYVADLELGTIVGSTTAGTNGNVVRFSTPGAFSVRFTGMRVTGHDGETPFHLVGVRPDVALAPTVEDIRAGRDPVLEGGLSLARASGPR